MRALLSVVGTRGDVQPVMALALELRALGVEVRLCVPPNFMDWAARLGFPAQSVGIEMRAPRPGAPPPAQLPDLITDQFDSVAAAAAGCDVILGANAHQYAARSIAELRGVPYVCSLYAPTALPTADNTAQWNARSLERVNANRTRLGLPAIDDVLRHIVGDAPWLASDPALDPISQVRITQTGAWVLADASALDAELERFLAAGPPPVYFGFGSMPVPASTSQTLIEATRAAGRRAIVSAGWSELDIVDQGSDCFAVGDVNQQALFPRVAAVVHHGGAGTTFTAARAGVPQLVVSMFSDQPYWGSRVAALGIGATLPMAELTGDKLSRALERVLEPAVATRAAAFAGSVTTDGASVAARKLAALRP